MTPSALFRSLLAPLLLTCHLLAEPALAAPEAPAGKLKVSQTQPEDANDPLRLWFQEQDKLLDDILVRLSRIEKLVGEIHRLIMALPLGTPAGQGANAHPAPATPAAPAASLAPPAPATTAPPAAQPPAKAPSAPPMPVIAPPPPAKAAPTGILGFFDNWGTELAAIGLLALVLMIGQRHARARKQKAAAAPDTASTDSIASLTSDEPAFLAEPEPPPVSPARPSARPAATPPRPATPAKPTPPSPPSQSPPPPAPPPAPPAPPASPIASTASVQRGGATEPSQGQADQALELAEIMLSMGLGHGAAQTLTEQIRHEPKQALRHWLRLLQIYRANGQQAEFEKSAEELRLHFNVQPEDWLSRGEAQRSIEDYPHIASRLMELWGRPSCLVYLSTLLSDNRGGARSGFPQSVAEELLLLTAMLKADGTSLENPSAPSAH